MNCGVIGGNRRHLSPGQGIPADSRGRICHRGFCSGRVRSLFLMYPFAA